jgi:chemotaxis protein methyltransferase CheR
MSQPSLTEREFHQFRDLALRNAGISMAASKKTLVESRLRKRVVEHGLSSYGEYLQLLTAPGAQAELQHAIDLLTTNETSFLREPKHFEHLREYALAQRQRSARFRAWSAACSTGEEPYSIAMVLAELLGTSDWTVAASDISTRVLEHARRGQYILERGSRLPQAWLRKYCLKGIGQQSGTFLIEPWLRSRVQFQHANLVERVSHREGTFDVIFLRNVMIYFDTETKRKVIANLLPTLKRGGILYIGHSETLNGICDGVEPVAPTVYRKP